jgi:hypothetical protein
MRLMIVSWLSNGCPLQFRLMNENSRCSILFPFAGSRRVVTDGDRYPDLIRHLLQVELPRAKSIPVTPSSIGANEQSPRRRIGFSPVQFPPAPDAFHRKFSRIVRHSHVDHRPVLAAVVDPIGKRLAFGQAGEVLVFTSCGLPFGRHVRPAFLKGPTNSFFLASTEITGSPVRNSAFTCRLMYPSRTFHRSSGGAPG